MLSIDKSLIKKNDWAAALGPSQIWGLPQFYDI
jgi:hypothetical protein